MSRLTKISLLATLVLAVLFFSVLWKEEPDFKKPIIDLSIESEPKHNDVYTKDLPVISGELTTDISTGTYILKGDVFIPEGKVVSVAPSTTVYAGRDTKIIVKGELKATNVLWQSNQVHPSRQYWHGLIVGEGGKITLERNVVKNATAALTANPNSVLIVNNNTFDSNVVSIVTLGGVTNINNSTFKNGTVGIQALSGIWFATFCTFENLADGMRIFHSSQPNISNISMRGIRNHSISYLRETDLTINKLNIATSDFDQKIYDGRKQPTYIWQGQEHNTSIVLTTN